MSADGKVKIERLTTGVPTLDAILHGGIPARTLNVITGGPGAGKSILALQILFHQAQLGRGGIYFDDITHLPEFFAADSIIKLSRQSTGLRVSRHLEVLKLRGSGYEPGFHFFDISSGGVTVYPRVSVPAEEESGELSERRLSTGVAGMDRMMEGGLPELTSTVFEGGTGTGKTTLALSFLVEGARKGEPGLFMTMDETRSQVIKLGARRGWDLPSFIDRGLLEIVYISPLDYVADALLQKAKETIARLGAKRFAMDSLNGLSLSIAAEGRGQELVYALVKSFRALGVTSILTHEAPQLLGTAELSAHGLSAIADNIVLLRYAEVESRLARAVSVLKMRGSGHDDTLRELIIAGDRVEVTESFQKYHGVLTGIPTLAENEPGARRRKRTPAPES